MLPNGGYFRSITCPYFESGSCERVYCHFRHKKKTDVNYIPTPLAELRKVVTPDTTTNAADLVPEYCPTPLDQLAQMNYSYANQAPERDRDSPDFECKSLLQTRPATALSDTVDAKTAASGDQGPVLVDTIEDDVGIVSNGQTKRRRLESDSNVTNKKSQTEIDREIEQSMKTKKKQASGSRLISEQEQQLNANIKKARVAHKGPDNAVIFNLT